MNVIKSNPITLVTLVAGFFMLFALSSSSMGQDRAQENIRLSPNAVVSQTIGTTEVTITYGRPSVRGRVIFGELVPFDEVWRTGADEATTITFSEDVTIEGEPLDAGTYGLFTIPQEDDEWTIIFNNIADQWGAYEYDAGEDILRLDVTSDTAPNLEQLMFYFEEVEESTGLAVLHWDDVKVSFRIDER